MRNQFPKPHSKFATLKTRDELRKLVQFPDDVVTVAITRLTVRDSTPLDLESIAHELRSDGWGANWERFGNGDVVLRVWLWGVH